jgi:uncharacterized protein YjbI with pentapeptide repeats
MDEVGLQHLQDSSDVAKWQQTFCHLIGFMLRHGMPMERLDPRPNFQEENRQARNSEDSLLAILGVFNRLTKNLSKIYFPSPYAFGTLLARLQGQRAGVSNTISFYCLSYLDLSGCILYATDFNHADLRGTNLESSLLPYVHFVGANLEGANLGGANLHWANLEGANLEGANLQRANLQEANLQGVGLRGANLQRANLHRANLEGADLRGANLQRAHLQDANLEGANLEGANLRGANLEGANLEWAILEETILEGEITGETPII